MHGSAFFAPAPHIYMHTTYLDNLRDPAVRDLAWVIGSPGLLTPAHPEYHQLLVEDAWCQEQLLACLPWLTKLDQAPHDLHEFIASRPTRRLGHYFETLIYYWLTHTPDTRLIANNLQVQFGQRTFGEFDFLFSDASRAVCHWEVAVKFYLQKEAVNEQRAFIGPGTQDRLDLKMDKVFQQQLQLGLTHAGLRALPPDIKLDRVQALIKGYLFYHASSNSSMATPGVSRDHLSGWWIRHGLDSLPEASTHRRWMLLPRLRWLAPARAETEADTLSDSGLTKCLDVHFNISKEALLVFEMTPDTSGIWQEKSRGFIVCSSWPDIHKTEMAQADLARVNPSKHKHTGSQK